MEMGESLGKRMFEKTIAPVLAEYEASLSPVEKAARDYTAAKNRAEQMTDELSGLKFKVQKADEELKRAVMDRDEKKIALQRAIEES